MYLYPVPIYDTLYIYHSYYYSLLKFAQSTYHKQKIFNDSILSTAVLKENICLEITILHDV